MCVLLQLLIRTALRAHAIVIEALYNYYYYDDDGDDDVILVKVAKILTPEAGYSCRRS